MTKCLYGFNNKNITFHCCEYFMNVLCYRLLISRFENGGILRTNRMKYLLVRMIQRFESLKNHVYNIIKTSTDGSDANSELRSHVEIEKITSPQNWFFFFMKIFSTSNISNVQLVTLMKFICHIKVIKLFFITKNVFH